MAILADSKVSIKIASKTGTIYAHEDVDVGGFDYAEYFQNSIRNIYTPGTIMTLVGDKVEPCSSDKDFILGTVTKTAGVIGNAAEHCWHKRYLTDSLGAPIYEDYEYVSFEYEINGERHFFSGDIKLSPIYVDPSRVRIEKRIRQKVNPDYNPDLTYIPRSERPSEHTLVSLLGQVFVSVNENISPGRYVSPLGFSSNKPTPLMVMRTMPLRRGYKALCLIRGEV